MEHIRTIYPYFSTRRTVQRTDQLQQRRLARAAGTYDADDLAFLYGQDILDLLGAKLIPPQEITLSKAVFRKEVTDHDLQ